MRRPSRQGGPYRPGGSLGIRQEKFKRLIPVQHRHEDRARSQMGKGLLSLTAGSGRPDPKRIGPGTFQGYAAAVRPDPSPLDLQETASSIASTPRMSFILGDDERCGY